MIVEEKVQLEEIGNGAEARGDLNYLTAASYEELRHLAASYLRGERDDHTLQATALVHEAFLRLVRLTDIPWKDQAHVVGCAARAMRRILVSYGRARSRLKRGGPGVVRLPLDETLDFSACQDLDLSAVDEALSELEAIDSRQAAIVEMRFFGGLTVDQIAQELTLSRATVKRDWATAKLWLREALC